MESYWKTKTEEELKEIKRKSLETRRKNIKKREDAKDEIRFFKKEIALLKAQKEELELELNQGMILARLVNQRFYCESKILESSISYDGLSGVYFLINDNKIIYIGQSKNVFARIHTHSMTKKFNKIAWVNCELKHLDIIESFYIHAFRPELNGCKNEEEKSAPLSVEKLYHLTLSENPS